MVAVVLVVVVISATLSLRVPPLIDTKGMLLVGNFDVVSKNDDDVENCP